MNEVVVAFKSDDIDFKKTLTSTFGEGVQIFESDGFDGNTFVFVALIPIVSVTVELVDFFLTHLVKNKNVHSDNRVVMKSKGNFISLTGYSRDEVIDILKEIKNRDKE